VGECVGGHPEPKLYVLGNVTVDAMQFGHLSGEAISQLVCSLLACLPVWSGLVWRPSRFRPWPSVLGRRLVVQPAYRAYGGSKVSRDHPPTREP
jgi:hypothetical protein